MHLGGQRAGGGAGPLLGGPDPGVWMAAGQFLGNGKGLADQRAVGGAQGRDGARGGEFGKLVGDRSLVEIDQTGGDGNAEAVEEKPAAQGPAGIGAVADEKLLSHGVRLGFAACRVKPILEMVCITAGD